MIMRTVWSSGPVDKRFIRASDGAELDTVYMHAYWVGDRLLEPFFIEVRMTQDKHLELKFTDLNKKLLQGLDQKFWLRKATEFALTHDVFYETSEGSGEDIYFK